MTKLSDFCNDTSGKLSSYGTIYGQSTRQPLAAHVLRILRIVKCVWTCTCLFVSSCKLFHIIDRFILFYISDQFEFEVMFLDIKEGQCIPIKVIRSGYLAKISIVRKYASMFVMITLSRAIANYTCFLIVLRKGIQEICLYPPSVSVCLC